MMRSSLFTLAVLMAVSFALIGCSRGGPELGYVKGKVSWKGNPVPNTEVIFQPAADTRASPSYARTDAEGNYVLKFNRDREGALLGEHDVSLSSSAEVLENGESVTKPEVFPPEYNSNTKLVREVKSGEQTIDFNLPE